MGRQCVATGVAQVSTTANNGGLVGHMVPFLLGLPSVRAMVVDISHGKQYILQQRYTTEDERGNHIDVEKQYTETGPSSMHTGLIHMDVEVREMAIVDLLAWSDSDPQSEPLLQDCVMMPCLGTRQYNIWKEVF